MVTAESALAAAVAITEEQGLANLSIHSLAAELGIKLASLYNHIIGIDEVNVAGYAAGKLNNVIRDAAVVLTSEYKELMSSYHLNVVHQIVDIYRLDDEKKRISCVHSEVACTVLFRLFISLEVIGAFGGSAYIDDNFVSLCFSFRFRLRWHYGNGGN
jgi:AcrR family transcriptional regulator